MKRLVLLILLAPFFASGQQNCKGVSFETTDEISHQTIRCSNEINVLTGDKINYGINFFFLKIDSTWTLKVDYVTPDMNSPMSFFYIHLKFNNAAELWLEEYKTGSEKTLVKNKTVTAAKQYYFQLTQDQVKTLREDEINSIEIRFFDQKKEPVIRKNLGSKIALKIKNTTSCMYSL